jgi:hypothetical protein
MRRGPIPHSGRRNVRPSDSSELDDFKKFCCFFDPPPAGRNGSRQYEGESAACLGALRSFLEHFQKYCPDFSEQDGVLWLELSRAILS